MLRDLFVLDPEVVFLNHGSFGACPRPVFEEYQHWQRELERQPVEFLARRYEGLIEAAKARLAEYLGARADDLVFVPNATAGMNVVARSLPLGPGDEVLVTNHEYGAVDLLWRHLCAPKGSGFLWARPEHQAGLEPPVLGWSERENSFAARHRWQGTRDPAAYLAVPAAIDFLAEHGWDEVRRRCHELAADARLRLA